MDSIWIQVVIALTGVVAIYLSQQDNESLKKYACIFGLLGQPFWFISAYQSEQWGIFLLCCFYSYAWYTGVNNNWIKPYRAKRV